MTMLAEHPKTLFVGQGVRYDCHRMWPTLEGVPMDKRIEMPVAEDFQMGFCLGLALEGYIPISIYPRWDFLLLAANQTINHLDKAPYFGWHPKVIIRVAVGTTSPLDPGPQHSQDHSRAFQQMLKTVTVLNARSTTDIPNFYARAMQSATSTIITEYMECY